MGGLIFGGDLLGGGAWNDLNVSNLIGSYMEGLYSGEVYSIHSEYFDER